MHKNTNNIEGKMNNPHKPGSPEWAEIEIAFYHHVKESAALKSLAPDEREAWLTLLDYSIAQLIKIKNGEQTLYSATLHERLTL